VAYHQAYPNEPQFPWNPDPEFRHKVSSDIEAELRVTHVVHTPGSYCSAGSVPL